MKNRRPPNGPRPRNIESRPKTSEGEYLQKLVRERTPIAVRLRDGMQVSGVVEYYDQRFIRLTRQGAPNLFIFKHDIKYIVESP